MPHIEAGKELEMRLVRWLNRYAQNVFANRNSRFVGTDAIGESREREWSLAILAAHLHVQHVRINRAVISACQAMNVAEAFKVFMLAVAHFCPSPNGRAARAAAGSL